MRCFQTWFKFLPLLLVLICPIHSALGDGGNLQNVKVRIGGKPLSGPVSAVSDSQETFVPLSALPLLGAKGILSLRGDTVTVTWGVPQRSAVLAVARPHGDTMLALSDLARIFHGEVVRPDAVGSNGKLETGTPGDTVYLLAKIESVELNPRGVKVVTSFPASTAQWMLSEKPPKTGVLDLYGTYLPSTFPNAITPQQTTQLTGITLTQNNLTTTRIALQLNPECSIRDASGTNRGTIQIAVIGGTPDRIEQVATAKWGLQPPTKSSGQEIASTSQAVTTQGGSSSATENNTQTSTPLTTSSTATGRVLTDPASNQTSANSTSALTTPGTLPSRSGDATRQDNPSALVITSVSFWQTSDNEAHLKIEASAPVSPIVHYLDNGSLQVEIPGASLQLADSSDASQTLSNPIVQSIQAVDEPSTKPAVCITIGSTHFLGFVMENIHDHVTFNLRLPVNATGKLAGKLVVIDPGHGGKDTGGTYAGYDEKNVVLSVGLKLRKVLESMGARVVMTRDRDIFIPLNQRPGLANQIHADFFISLHNDDCSVPNSASGTTTYYHDHDPSSRAFATAVQDAIVKVSGLPSRGARSDTDLYANGLAVLRGSNMPAILVEIAFINNDRDRAKLLNPSFQQTVAQAIAKGLRNYVEGTSQTAMLTQPLGSTIGMVK